MQVTRAPAPNGCQLPLLQILGEPASNLAPWPWCCHRQIAPFREPPVNNSAANNQQLREAAFRVLFQWQVGRCGGQTVVAGLPQVVAVGYLVRKITHLGGGAGMWVTGTLALLSRHHHSSFLGLYIPRELSAATAEAWSHAAAGTRSIPVHRLAGHRRRVCRAGRVWPGQLDPVWPHLRGAHPPHSVLGGPGAPLLWAPLPHPPLRPQQVRQAGGKAAPQGGERSGAAYCNVLASGRRPHWCCDYRPEENVPLRSSCR